MIRRLTIALAAACAVTAGLAVSATGATVASAAPVARTTIAAPALCPDGWCGLWGTVTEYPKLALRTGPTVNWTTINGYANYNDDVEVQCWAAGDDVNTDPYWDRVADLNTGVAGYAPDAWIYTGGNITSQVRHC
jgi:hypothetical protein